MLLLGTEKILLRLGVFIDFTLKGNIFKEPTESLR